MFSSQKKKISARILEAGNDLARSGSVFYSLLCMSVGLRSLKRCICSYIHTCIPFFFSFFLSFLLWAGGSLELIRLTERYQSPLVFFFSPPGSTHKHLRFSPFFLLLSLLSLLPLIMRKFNQKDRGKGAISNLRDGAAGEVGAQLVTMAMGSAAVSCERSPHTCFPFPPSPVNRSRQAL